MFFLLFASNVTAETSEKEIAHLLTFIEQSECTFFRNGKAHTPEEARAHIERKYNHIKKRISTSEQFIKHAASKSSISRKPYTVTCGTVELTSENWLKEELKSYQISKGYPAKQIISK